MAGCFQRAGVGRGDGTGSDVPEPYVLSREIADDLQTVLDQFAGIAGELRK